MPLVIWAIDVRVPVWGDVYVRTFLDYALPTQLAEGNLPALASYPIRYRIFTDPIGEQNIRKAEIFWILCQYATVQFVHIDCFGRHKYKISNAAYIYEINKTNIKNTVFIFLVATCCLSINSLKNGLKRIADGYRAVNIYGPRMQASLVMPWLMHDRGQGKANHALALTGSRCVEMMLSGMSTIYSLWTWPSTFFMPVDQEGYVIKSAVYHPLMLCHPDQVPNRVHCSIDTSLIFDYVKDYHDVYCVQDGEEISAFSLSHEQPPTIVQEDYWNLDSIWERYDRYANAHHYLNLTKTVQLRKNTPSSENWQQTIEKMEQFSDRLLAYCDFELRKKVKERSVIGRVRHRLGRGEAS